MALSVLGLLIQPGLELAQTGINASAHNITYKPEWVRKTPNFQNQTVGRALPSLASRELTISGDFLNQTAAGIMTATFLVDSAGIITNDVAEFGGAVGVLMLDEVTVTQERASDRSLSFKFSSDPLFTAV